MSIFLNLRNHKTNSVLHYLTVQISIDHPAAVATCNMDLEQLINDSNRSIATLAITTLLKTGAESSVERLMKQIGHFVSDIPDEFKIVVIQAIRWARDEKISVFLVEFVVWGVCCRFSILGC